MANSKLTTQQRTRIASSNTVETGKSSVGNFTREFGDAVKQSVAPIPDTFLNQLLGMDSPDTRSHQSGQPIDMKAGRSSPSLRRRKRTAPDRTPTAY